MSCNIAVSAQAQVLFERICPGVDFLPQPPDPEDIIYEENPGNEDTNEPQGQVPPADESQGQARPAEDGDETDDHTNPEQ